MLVECIFNSGKDLPIDSRCLNETDETDYSFLKIGAKYIVYGLMFYSCRIDYLICSGKGKPIWIPANLCKIIDSKLSSNWSVCITHLNEDYKVLYDSFNIQSIISYPELVTSISHYLGIIERESDDMKRFFLEKEKMDRESDHVIN
ncbi:hypothetical protein [Snodgrassella alvi]|uniref:Uncharacterized protein n=1 Tax=Snodgrassella alvi TaxID=1196083 RepID=A0A2N9X6X2_9NEIS|nr:hypothetical protein [Snodgrassella alvi]PIT39266.1 hypothetical protein BHC54_05985 [Snodgrassella alvi]